MGDGPEARGSGGFGRGPVHRTLSGGRQPEVDDLTAPRANEVMVMAGQILGQLEAGEFVAAEDPMDHARLLENGEIPIGRTLRHVGPVGDKLGRGHRSPGRDQGVDQTSATGGVPLVDPAQTGGCRRVELV